MPWLSGRRVSFTMTGGLLVTPEQLIDGALRAEGGRVVALAERLTPAARDVRIDLHGDCVYPGLINAHDHLELDLFPNIGQGPYPNSYAWFDDVNRMRDHPSMARVLEIPIDDRLRWGGYRCLFSGVTTVVHHNPYHPHLFKNGFPTRVLRRYRWSHTLRLAGTYGGRPEEEFRKTRGIEPFIIHLAEGVDEIAAEELTELDRLGALQSNTVLVHGVGLTPNDRALLHTRRASLVWCPSSNLFLFRRTADIPSLLGRIRIAIGTDSTLSGSPTLFDELRTADGLGYADPVTLTKMVTTAPAEIFGIAHCAGRLAVTHPADILVLARTEDDPHRNLIKATPARVRLVLVGGLPRLGDEEFEMFFRQCGVPFERVRVDGAMKLVTGQFSALFDRIHGWIGNELPIPIG